MNDLMSRGYEKKSATKKATKRTKASSLLPDTVIRGQLPVKVYVPG
jgi:hypothetical protein